MPDRKNPYKRKLSPDGSYIVNIILYSIRAFKKEFGKMNRAAARKMSFGTMAGNRRSAGFFLPCRL